MPRKGYGTITVKVETLQKFLKAKHNAKTANPRMQNSKFLDLLLEMYKQSKT
ncbi:protein of unknown function [Nitrosotalea devaniterrae]|uniref:Uncharacterized protein n=1 Tax=Nitrosotalea devaniterrae TaxID=1078905 RepID=A0A128A5K3_9ARCH|nr:protein of unknown function [Candidatus Nitrosotalea devanaterra]